jgi:hypothetical protein
MTDELAGEEATAELPAASTQPHSETFTPATGLRGSGVGSVVRGLAVFCAPQCLGVNLTWTCATWMTWGTAPVNTSDGTIATMADNHVVTIMACRARCVTFCRPAHLLSQSTTCTGIHSVFPATQVAMRATMNAAARLWLAIVEIRRPRLYTGDEGSTLA